MRLDVSCHVVYVYKNFPSLGRVIDFDPVLALKQNDKFQGINRIKPEVTAKEWLVVPDIFRFNVQEVEVLYNLLLKRLFQSIYVLFGHTIL